jgi:hypothetical protein
MAAMPCNRKTLAAFFLFGVTGVLSAQQPSLPVDTILARLRANITDYRTSVPNFSCDEFVDSVRLDDGKIQDETKVQSSFRITRTTGGNLQETRIKNTVDGKPTKSQKVSLPFTFNGGFADMLQFLGSDCFEYRLGDPIPTDTSQVVLLFSMKPTFVGSPRCGLNKSERGTVVIDPDSFHVVQFTYQVEDIDLGWLAKIPFVAGPSKHNILIVTVGFAPVSLGDKVFWLPRQVASSLTAKTKPIGFRYQANYSNYHRFTSSVTIGAASPTSAPE